LNEFSTQFHNLFILLGAATAQDLQASISELPSASAATGHSSDLPSGPPILKDADPADEAQENDFKQDPPSRHESRHPSISSPKSSPSTHSAPPNNTDEDTEDPDNPIKRETGDGSK